MAAFEPTVDVTDPGPIRRTRPRQESSAVTKSYTAVSKEVRDTGLLDRTRGFYGALAGGLLAALGAAVAGFVLLGDSWLQLIIAVRDRLGLFGDTAGLLASHGIQVRSAVLHTVEGISVNTWRVDKQLAADLPDPAILLVVVTTGLGAAFGALGGRLRERAASR